MSVTTFMRPYSEQPRPGQQVRVFMKDGSETKANCTLIVAESGRYIQWYDTKTRDAIDVNQIKGWLPADPKEPT